MGVLAFALLPFALAATLDGPSGELRREEWPDGSPRAEYEVEVVDGHDIRDGSYRSWYANGQLESEGSFAMDLETGRWKTFHPSGRPASVGSFARGERTGLWETHHPNGERASKGRFNKGGRKGEWRFWGEDGSLYALHTGSYEAFEQRGPDGRTLVGELLDETPHGEWKSTWPNGAPELVGRLERGVRVGPWLFHNPDGSVSPRLSGYYDDGRRIGPAPIESLGAQLATPTAPSAPEPGPLGWPEDQNAIEAELETWLEADAKAFTRIQSELARNRKQPSWAKAGIRAMPIVLRRLLACDGESAAGRTKIGRLETRVLRPLCAGHALFPQAESGPATTEEARELQRAWATLWEATRDDTWFWRVELPLAPPTTDDERLLERPYRRAFAKAEARDAPAPLFRGRFEPREEDIEGPLLAALDWLERSQLPDGHWSMDHGAQDMAAGHPYDGGVTALALLALLGTGRMPTDSAAANAIGWLLEQQDPTTGRIGDPRNPEWIYVHAMATFALSEAQILRRDELLLPRLQRAVDVLFGARNPYGAWRYASPPNGENDTSITAWAAAALFLAREAGLEGEFEGAFEGALRWIDEATDPDSGRVGYDVARSYSSRNEKNERFPREKGEAMTAAALFLRRLLGVPVSAPFIQEQIGALRSKPPIWDPPGLGIDEYYFYYGAQALALCGEEARGHWKAPLLEIAHSQSGNAAERGSWDPVGVWAESGGRVYSTALLALALEASFRYTLPDMEEPGRKGRRGR